ncbi:MAG: hypothetical protein IKY75_04570 [Bacteroidaceae bacterium]|nr:hypothetical protein [Bacteroidaceae bacterium]
MLKTILITIVIIAIVVLLLGFRVFFIKGGRFPSMHISSNKEMKRKGISCAVSTDARDRSRKNLDDVLKEN